MFSKCEAAFVLRNKVQTRKKRKKHKWHMRNGRRFFLYEDSNPNGSHFFQETKGLRRKKKKWNYPKQQHKRIETKIFASFVTEEKYRAIQSGDEWTTFVYPHHPYNLRSVSFCSNILMQKMEIHINNTISDARYPLLEHFGDWMNQSHPNRETPFFF